MSWYLSDSVLFSDYQNYMWETYGADVWYGSDHQYGSYDASGWEYANLPSDSWLPPEQPYIQEQPESFNPGVGPLDFAPPGRFFFDPTIQPPEPPFYDGDYPWSVGQAY